MQEDIERRTVALSVKTTKLTGRVLAKSFATVLRKIQKEYRKAQTPQGKQSVKKLKHLFYSGIKTLIMNIAYLEMLYIKNLRIFSASTSIRRTGPQASSTIAISADVST